MCGQVQRVLLVTTVTIKDRIELELRQASREWLHSEWFFMLHKLVAELVCIMFLHSHCFEQFNAHASIMVSIFVSSKAMSGLFVH